MTHKCWGQHGSWGYDEHDCDCEIGESHSVSDHPSPPPAFDQFQRSADAL